MVSESSARRKTNRKESLVVRQTGERHQKAVIQLQQIKEVAHTGPLITHHNTEFSPEPINSKALRIRFLPRSGYKCPCVSFDYNQKDFPHLVEPLPKANSNLSCSWISCSGKVRCGLFPSLFFLHSHYDSEHHVSNNNAPQSPRAPNSCNLSNAEGA